MLDQSINRSQNHGGDQIYTVEVLDSEHFYSPRDKNEYYSSFPEPWNKQPRNDIKAEIEIKSLDSIKIPSSKDARMVHTLCGALRQSKLFIKPNFPSIREFSNIRKFWEQKILWTLQQLLTAIALDQNHTIILSISWRSNSSKNAPNGGQTSAKMTAVENGGGCKSAAKRRQK
jgi:hypothetical protein